MKRTISTERLYMVSNYNNIKFLDAQEFDLPLEKVLDQDFVNKVYYGQMISADINFLRYMKLKTAQGSMKLDEALTYLENEKISISDEIQKELDK